MQAVAAAKAKEDKLDEFLNKAKAVLRGDWLESEIGKQDTHEPAAAHDHAQRERPEKDSENCPLIFFIFLLLTFLPPSPSFFSFFSSVDSTLW